MFFCKKFEKTVFFVHKWAISLANWLEILENLLFYEGDMELKAPDPSKTVNFSKCQPRRFKIQLFYKHFFWNFYEGSIGFTNKTGTCFKTSEATARSNRILTNQLFKLSRLGLILVDPRECQEMLKMCPNLEHYPLRDFTSDCFYSRWMGRFERKYTQELEQTVKHFKSIFRTFFWAISLLRTDLVPRLATPQNWTVSRAFAEHFLKRSASWEHI